MSMMVVVSIGTITIAERITKICFDKMKLGLGVFVTRHIISRRRMNIRRRRTHANGTSHQDS